MKTTPLPEILKQITPLPYRVGQHPGDGSGTNWRTIESAGAVYSPAFTGTAQLEDAAYLTHAANVLPGLVEALRDVPDTLETLADDSEEAGWPARARNARKLAKSLRKALSLATNVPVNS